jgi:hypothetical protein
VTDDLAREQLRDDLDGLEHHRAADRHLGPDRGDDVLVECLAGAETEIEPPGYIAPRVAAAWAMTAGW